jgi:hypothetical protein
MEDPIVQSISFRSKHFFADNKRATSDSGLMTARPIASCASPANPCRNGFNGEHDPRSFLRLVWPRRIGSSIVAGRRLDPKWMGFCAEAGASHGV